MADEFIAVGQAAKKTMHDRGDGTHGEVVAAGGLTDKVQATITRPADTTAYAAGDAITNSTTAPTTATIECGRVTGGGGVILDAMLIDSASQATAGEFEVWLFDTTITADNDNAAFTPSDAECLTLVRIISFSSSLSYVGTASGNRVYQADPVNATFTFKCAAGSKNLHWALVARNAYTPISAETFTLSLGLQQD